MTEEKTLFHKLDLDLGTLLAYIDSGSIGLPDIQRPFVWPATKVRDLFDSMYRGFPVGSLLFWRNPSIGGTKAIGIDGKAFRVPDHLIIDGQQRLTSLYAVLKGKAVRNQNYEEERIEISFRPLDSRFEVMSAAIQKDPDWIPDISVIWENGNSFKAIKDYLKILEQKRDIPPEQEDVIASNIDRLFDLKNYPFTALEIAESVNEEQVADIFVRINSEGVKLNQADFILTLLSVFCEDMRHTLEDFCFKSRTPAKPGTGSSPYNHFIEPSPDQLLRVAIALGFGRGRLQSVYPLLRGKDLETGSYSPERRDVQFDRLRESQNQTIDLINWHQFFSALKGAGYISGELVSSKNALIYAYSFYIIGRTRFHIPIPTLDRLIGRWFYTITLSSRYSNSPETMMDMDLALFREQKTGEEFIDILEKIISSTLTGDFWNITLPNDLESSAARSPMLYAFYAAQIKLGVKALFSDKSLSTLLDPTIQSKKKFLDRHHLFPKAYLERLGETEQTKINQIANYTFVEWPVNIRISDTPPKDYIPQLIDRFSPQAWADMHKYHALPLGWEKLPYEEFLKQRRGLMAKIIKMAFETL